MKRYKQPWIESETLSIAIGQGYDLVTPLQSARMIAMIANDGRPVYPHMLKSVLSPSRKKLKDYPVKQEPPVIKREVLETIQEGLIGVVHGAGTARRLSKRLTKSPPPLS